MLIESLYANLASRQLMYRLSAWNDIQISDKCMKAQQDKKDSVFWLALTIFCDMTLHDFLPFLRPNMIADPSNGLSLSQF